MLKALIKVKLAGIKTWFAGGSKNKKNSTMNKILFTVLMLYVVVCFGNMFGSIFSELAPAFVKYKMGWLLFSFYGLIDLSLMIITTIFTAKSQIFEAQDNDLLLSMPIPSRYIIISRFAPILALNMVFEMLILIPLIYACFFKAKMMLTAVGFISIILFAFALPLFATTIACLLGWFVSVITKRMRNKSIITVIMSLIFIAGYMYLISMATNKIPDLIQNPNGMAGKLSAVAPIYWFGSAIANGNIMHMLYILLITVLPFIVICMVISKTFYAIVGDNKSAAKKKYVRKELKTKSPKAALLSREFQHLVSSAPYLLNAGFGVILVIIVSVLCVLYRNKISLILPAFMALPKFSMGGMAALAGCFFSGTILFTAPSISIEGKTLWILNSIPVNEKDVLYAKLKMHNIITLPAMIILELCISLVFRLTVAESILAFIVTIIYTLLISELGLIINLKNPYLNWPSETMAVKQSFSVLITMLSAIALVVLPVVFTVIIGLSHINMLVMNIGYAAFLIAMLVLTHTYIVRRGTMILRDLA